MAIIKYGALVTGIKGKIGGTIFQGGRSGGVVKNLNRKSGAVVGKGREEGSSSARVGKAFAETVKSWSTLTPTERFNWSNLLGIWTFTNKFGDVYNGTAYQIFTACNINRLALGLTKLTQNPIFEAAFDLGLSFDDFSVSGTWNRTTTNNDAVGQYRVAYFSKPVNPTIPASKARFSFVNAALVPAPGVFDLKASYVAWLGYTPEVGSIFYVRFWTCWANYPKIQFEQYYKIEVVA